MDCSDFMSLVLYYGRTGFYHSMQRAALDGLAKYPMESAFRLFNGISLALGNRVQEGIRELNPLKNDPDLALSSILSLLHAHKRCTIIDQDAIFSLEQRIDDEKHSARPIALYYAAIFLYLNGMLEKAHEYTDKAIKLDSQLEEARILKAWCELNSAYINGTIKQIFETKLERSNGKNIDVSLGLVRYYELSEQYEAAISVLNKLSVRFPELNIPLIEKMGIQLAQLDWDHALETAMRIINLDSNNIAALKVKSLLLICKESNFKAAAASLHMLYKAAERVEVGNYMLILQISQLFSRICSRNELIIQLTLSHIEKINHLNNVNSIFASELGYQHLMLGSSEDALSYFREATKIDGNDFNALCGLVLCRLINASDEDKNETLQHIELMEELCGNKRDPMFLYIKAKLAPHSDAAIKLLVEASDCHLKQLESITFSGDYLRQFNPDFLLQITTEFLRHTPQTINIKACCQMDTSQNTIHITLKHCLTILGAIEHFCPGHIQAVFMRAKVEFLCGDSSSAMQRLHRILNEIDKTYSEAHLLLAQIQLQNGQLVKASQFLELALSHKFTVRDNPMYHLLRGTILRHQKQLPEAQQTLLTAMHLIGTGNSHVQTVVRKGYNPVTETSSQDSLCLFDRATLYLELIRTLREIGDSQSIYESERLLENALDEFGNTSVNGRLIIAKAEFMLQSCNVSKAITLLSGIKPKDVYYIQAKTQLADIYLQHRKNRIAFSKCYKELVNARPEPECFLLLGEAYMSIQEPELAVEAYKKATELNTENSLLASKLGRAYVKTHQYNKAIKYYLEAIKNPEHSGLKLDLAELYLKLKHFQEAMDILENDVEPNLLNDQNIVELQLRTKKLLLLSRIHEKSGNINNSLKTLREARDNQLRVHKRCSVDQSGSIYEQYKILTKICLLMAQQSVSIRENSLALAYFKECIKYAPNDVDVLVEFARHYMHMNSMELCRDVCVQILQIDKNNEAASVMMADLAFRKMEFENAVYHFSQLLVSQPCYWTALARLIEVMRRSGTLSETLPFLQRAEQATLNPTQSPGFNYCRGLYEWYSGNPNGSLRHFNTSRRDHEWGQQAIFNMIEICINPEGDIPSSYDSNDDSGELNDSRLIALRTAERLLKELRPRPGGIDNEVLNYRILFNFLQMASKQKFQIERALQDFTDLAQREDYQHMVGPIYGIASALIQLKQVQRAKNQLKRIARFSWNFEEAEYLERSWLLLADIYIHSNKFDVAETFVQRVLEHNKSSAKAYELAGYIAEKLQNYCEATQHYHNAWHCGGRSKPHIGYKLAYNHMKRKRYAESIDVCQQVMKLHPDYTVIRKEVLDKCRNNLRA